MVIGDFKIYSHRTIYLIVMRKPLAVVGTAVGNAAIVKSTSAGVLSPGDNKYSSSICPIRYVEFYSHCPAILPLPALMVPEPDLM